MISLLKRSSEMPEDRDALLHHYADMRAEFQAAIAGLTPQQMSDPSIDGWSVKDHMLHIATWDDVRASEVERISAGHASTWRMSEAEDDVYNNMSYELRKELSLEQAVYEYDQSRTRLLAAIQNATDRGLDGSLYGEAGLISSHEAEHAGWIRAWRTRTGVRPSL
jgi:hypothetical protein